MDIDEYKEKVIELILSGDKRALEAAAHAVLWCSEEGHEFTEYIDQKLGVSMTNQP